MEPNQSLIISPTALGEGRSAKVFLGSYQNQPVAVKVFHGHWCEQNYKYVVREILHNQALSVYQHPHIANMRCVALMPQGLSMVMDLVDGLPLDKYQEQLGGRLPVQISRRIFQQLVLAVDFCHRLGKVNRDVTMSNVLVDTHGPDVNVKLCDFSTSKDVQRDSEPKTQLGMVLFSAPEIVLATPEQPYDAMKVDVWSVGIILCTLVFGQHPFLSPADSHLQPKQQIMGLLHRSLAGQIQVPQAEADQYPDAADLVSKMLIPNPDHRVSLTDVMQHPWFRANIPAELLVLNDSLISEPPQASTAVLHKDVVKRLVTDAVNAYRTRMAMLSPVNAVQSQIQQHFPIR